MSSSEAGGPMSRSGRSCSVLKKQPRESLFRVFLLPCSWGRIRGSGFSAEAHWPLTGTVLTADPRFFLEEGVLRGPAEPPDCP